MPKHQNYEDTLRELAHRLASLRQRSGLSGAALAVALGTTQASISRIETGQQRPKSETVMRWAEETGASNNELDEIGILFELLTREYISFRQEHRQGVSASQSKTLAEESAFDHIRISQTALVPGLLQSPTYARHIFGLGPREHSASEIAKSVEIRTQRQEQLYDESRRFEFLIFEQALWATYAPEKIMRNQFDHILHFSSFENIWIGIVPLKTLLPAIPIVSFEMFGNEYLIVETSTAYVTITEKEEVATYGNLFQQWSDLAVSGSKLTKWLKEFSHRYTENFV